jgi:hypothetical protein
VIHVGARVQVIDHADARHGRYGTVTRGEHPAILTGRPCVEMNLDGDESWQDEAWYVEQVDELHSLRVVA